MEPHAPGLALPRKPARARAPKRAETTTARRGATTGKRLRPRVLIVEDHQDLREMYAEYLAYVGWQVEHVANGEEALAVAATFMPAVIVMDLRMPVLDGVETTRRLKKNARTQKIPIVALSAHQDKIGEAASAGAETFVAKPCTPRELLAVLESLVDRGNGGTRARRK